MTHKDVGNADNEGSIICPYRRPAKPAYMPSVANVRFRPRPKGLTGLSVLDVMTFRQVPNLLSKLVASSATAPALLYLLYPYSRANAPCLHPCRQSHVLITNKPVSQRHHIIEQRLPSIIGRNNLKTGLLACIYSLVGALLGGLVMYVWGAYDLPGASHVLTMIPAISPEMITQVHTQLVEQGALAIMTGPVSGTPYKIYAIQSETAGIGLLIFMLISIPARLIRFILLTTILHYAHKAICHLLRRDDSLHFLILGWIIFYMFYFYFIQNKIDRIRVRS